MATGGSSGIDAIQQVIILQQEIARTKSEYESDSTVGNRKAYDTAVSNLQEFTKRYELDLLQRPHVRHSDLSKNVEYARKNIQYVHDWTLARLNYINQEYRKRGTRPGIEPPESGYEAGYDAGLYALMTELHIQESLYTRSFYLSMSQFYVAVVGLPKVGKTTYCYRLAHKPLDPMKYDKTRVMQYYNTCISTSRQSKQPFCIADVPYDYMKLAPNYKHVIVILDSCDKNLKNSFLEVYDKLESDVTIVAICNIQSQKTLYKKADYDDIKRICNVYNINILTASDPLLHDPLLYFMQTTLSDTQLQFTYGHA